MTSEYVKRVPGIWRATNYSKTSYFIFKSSIFTTFEAKTQQPMKVFGYLALLGTLFSTTSCATIFSGTTQRVTIDSKPQGAEIVIEGESYGKTPAQIKVDRELEALLDESKEIQLRLDGYLEFGYEMEAYINPVAIINLFNLFGWAIDAATGAVTKYDNYYIFRLRPLDKLEPEKVQPSPVKPQEVKPDTQQQGEDKYDKLIRLKKLLDDGIITQEEYDKEKKKILDGE